LEIDFELSVQDGNPEWIEGLRERTSGQRFVKHKLITQVKRLKPFNINLIILVNTSKLPWAIESNLRLFRISLRLVRKVTRF